MKSWGPVLAIWVAAIGIMLLSILMAPSFSGERSSESVKSPQVLLEFNHQDKDGRAIVVPQGKVVLALVPIQPLHPAPMETGTLMLCRMFTIDDGSVMRENHPPTPHREIGFRCGDSVYEFTAMDIHGEGQAETGIGVQKSVTGKTEER
jgi:hypothetical protein